MDFYNKGAGRNLPLLPEVVIGVLVLFCLALILASLGCSEKSDEEITAAAEQAAHDKKITFTFPLEYTATATQCSNKDGCRTRYYFPRER